MGLVLVTPSRAAANIGGNDKDVKTLSTQVLNITVLDLVTVITTTGKHRSLWKEKELEFVCVGRLGDLGS